VSQELGTKIRLHHSPYEAFDKWHELGRWLEREAWHRRGGVSFEYLKNSVTTVLTRLIGAANMFDILPAF
jgi:hypothetical protein